MNKFPSFEAGSNEKDPAGGPKLTSEQLGSAGTYGGGSEPFGDSAQVQANEKMKEMFEKATAKTMKAFGL
jgi:hypothetical protein